MISRKGLSRKTPLHTTKPLKAKRISIVPGKTTTNPRKPLMAKPKPMSPEEKNGKDTVRKRSLVGEVRMCEIAIYGVCTGYATDWHHRQNRSQLGSWDPANGMDSCRHCHMTVTDTREEYYNMGWCVYSHEDPLTKPVFRRGQWVVLDSAGGFTPALPLGGAA